MTGVVAIEIDDDIDLFIADGLSDLLIGEPAEATPPIESSAEPFDVEVDPGASGSHEALQIERLLVVGFENTIQVGAMVSEVGSEIGKLEPTLWLARIRMNDDFASPGQMHARPALMLLRKLGAVDWQVMQRHQQLRMPGRVVWLEREPFSQTPQRLDDAPLRELFVGELKVRHRFQHNPSLLRASLALDCFGRATTTKPNTQPDDCGDHGHSDPNSSGQCGKESKKLLTKEAHQEQGDGVSEKRAPEMRPKGDLGNAKEGVEHGRHPQEEPQRKHRDETAPRERLIVLPETGGDSLGYPVASNEASEREADDARRHGPGHRQGKRHRPRPDERRSPDEHRTGNAKGLQDRIRADERYVAPWSEQQEGALDLAWIAKMLEHPQLMGSNHHDNDHCDQSDFHRSHRTRLAELIQPKTGSTMAKQEQPIHARCSTKGSDRVVQATMDCLSTVTRRAGASAGAWVLILAIAGCEPPARLVVPSPSTISTQAAGPAAPTSSPPSAKATSPFMTRPGGRRLARWRTVAGDPKATAEQRSRALRQLALWQDDQGVALAVAALADSRLQIRAARALVHHAAGKLPRRWSPALVTKVTRGLEAALQAAPEVARPDLAVALVQWRAKLGVAACLALLRSGELSEAKRLDGGNAYDPLELGSLVPRAELHKLATEPNTAVRRFAAIALSQRATQTDSAVLLGLLADPEATVASEAAVGLLRIGTAASRAALHKRLGLAKRGLRLAFLQALHRSGARGLVFALDAPPAVPGNESQAWFRNRQLFEMLRLLRDPRGGSALSTWIQRAKRHPHWQAVAAQRLAEIGDLGAAPYLGKHMLLEPATVYDISKFWQADAGGHLRRSDRPRIISARLLADLAAMHPGDHSRLRNSAEGPVLKWLNARFSPHANGLRFLAAADSRKALVQLRAWAFPNDPLPAAGAQPPFPMAFEISQMALRYIGHMRDQQSLAGLLQQLERNKSPKVDITQDALTGGGIAMRGMALRAVSYGAANGLSEWGPQRKEPITSRLRAFVEDKLQHEEARTAACQALAWVASGAQSKKMLRRIDTLARSADPKDLFIADCYAQTLARRARPQLAAQLVASLLSAPPPRIQTALALAIGRAGLAGSPAGQTKLLAAVPDGPVPEAATLALLLGGSIQAASRAANLLRDKSAGAVSTLKDSYYRALGYWSNADLSSGSVYRWVRNARGLEYADAAAPQSWASKRLAAQLDNLLFDNGPHSLTRNVLVFRLRQAARSSQLAKRQAAIATLQLMNEHGTLMALGEGKDETARLARRASFELHHPAP